MNGTIHDRAFSLGIMIGCDEKCKAKASSLDKPKNPLFIDYLKLIAESSKKS